MKWKAYDPSWLVNLAQEQLADRPEIAKALAACRRAAIESRAYLHFVDAANANKPGAEWQFAENVRLEDPKQGDLILDVLKDGRIGGVEFLARL